MAKGSRTTTTRSLTQLSPTDFENLIYDLVILRGMVNVVWRTPGADGGRDIEAESMQTDLSGVQSAAKWYVECKKYTGSVDWPTIHPKLAYAEAADAEYLLLCTTSKFTPQAVSTAAQWNDRRRPPVIRLWPGHEIENQLRLHPDLKLKYGLSRDLGMPGPSFVSLSLALSKTIGSYYGAAVMTGKGVDRMLRAANSIALLMQVRMEELDRGGRISVQAPSGQLDVDADIAGKLIGLDEPAVAAFVNYASALSGKRLKLTFADATSCRIDGWQGFEKLLRRYRDTFSAIAVWGNFDFTFDDKSILLRQRHV
jgi:hypothetical protein